MRVIKKYIVFPVLLLLYVSVVSLLLKQYDTFCKAYRMMSMQITHATIETSYEEEPEGE